jgi:hypothetical protein
MAHHGTVDLEAGLRVDGFVFCYSKEIALIDFA